MPTSFLRNDQHTRQVKVEYNLTQTKPAKKHRYLNWLRADLNKSESIEANLIESQIVFKFCFNKNNFGRFRPVDSPCFRAPFFPVQRLDFLRIATRSSAESLKTWRL